jgi:hypothetical protein
MTFQRVENFKYLGGTLNEDNHQTDLQERVNMLPKHTLCNKFFSDIKIYLKTKIKTKEYNNEQNVNICIRNLESNKE